MITSRNGGEQVEESPRSQVIMPHHGDDKSVYHAVIGDGIGINGKPRSPITSRLLVVSGKMGAGKDTIAPRVADRLWPGSRIVHLSFAAPLKTEVNTIINEIRRSSDRANAVDRVLELTGVREDQARQAVDILYDAVIDYPGMDAFQHTPVTRQINQWWGSDVRRAQDPDYWVSKASVIIRNELDAGNTVILTDGRFPNEIALVERMGGVTVRINVTPETQRNRILFRDGVEPDKVRLGHVSETSCDNLSGWVTMIDSDDLNVNQTVDAIIDGVRAYEKRG